jgi:hypothetical protein
MNRFGLSILVIFAVLLNACRSGKPVAVKETQALFVAHPSPSADLIFALTGTEPLSAEEKTWLQLHPWDLQPEWQVFGSPGPYRIRVNVSGQVNRAGIYNLIDGSTLRDALNAAQGGTRIMYWPGSRLVRMQAGSTNEVIQLRHREQNESIVLQDGDWLSFGVEVY